MANRFVGLLRGINVGGKTLVKMSELRDAVEQSNYTNVHTYINSGNLFFESNTNDTLFLASDIERIIADHFGLSVRVVVFSLDEMEAIVESMPIDWGEKVGWKYNTLFMLNRGTESMVAEQVGVLKDDIETLAVGPQVVFQSVEFSQYGKSRTAKLVSLPVYKQMTIRNYNTTIKLLELLRA